MVKINGVEVTQEELDKLIADKTATDVLVKGYEDKVKNLETKTEGLDELEALRKENQDNKDKLYQNALGNRADQIKKYLDTKGNSETILKKIGDMSEEDFEEWAEGKTDVELQTKEEIESAKTDIDEEKTEIEKNKEKIISEYLKTREEENKTKDDQDIVPTGEVGTEAGDEGTESGFPSIPDIKKTYKLDRNPIYDKSEAMEENAVFYLESYGDRDLQ